MGGRNKEFVRLVFGREFLNGVCMVLIDVYAKMLAWRASLTSQTAKLKFVMMIFVGGWYETFK